MLAWAVILVFGANYTAAQNEFAASLEVLNAGVEVQRANTVNPIVVNVEAIVGVGDVIRTDGTGQARITFFADGTDTTISPNSEYRILELQTESDDFRVTVELVAGETANRLNRVLGANSSYEVETPAMTLAARGTNFSVRVAGGGRSWMLVREGMASAGAQDENAEVPAEFGVRSDRNRPLSDVVRASSYAELDAALDGCEAGVTMIDDVRLNVRLGPSLEQPRVGTIAPDEIFRFFGVNTTGDWYRINYRSGFGWVLSTTAEVVPDCAGLRVFEDGVTEDPLLYSQVGDPIDPDTLGIPEATPEAQQ
ncbi:MAG: SH3 domain-containing protein [Chloroflexi bacterium]|nr:SH3 domain-containing protein [Chloroflexota bacterium]